MSADLPGDAGRTNPFASRFIRPGALPFLFPPGASAEQLVARLHELGDSAEIRGPHGSGKSTLLATLVEALRAAGHLVELAELHDGQRQLPPEFAARLQNSPRGTFVAIDGYEQLGWWNRRRLAAWRRRRGLQLVVTCHQAAGLPLLWETRPTLALAREIVARLVERCPEAVTPEQIERAFTAQGGDLREMLFELYDHCERPSGH
ncbi:MAG: hypothetical protein KF708_03815 [Pirellulales bacterium]|nr:hypothetical protein [Pirellulales bacterium]